MSRRLLVIALGAALAAGCSDLPSAPESSADVAPVFLTGPAPFTPGQQQPLVNTKVGPLNIRPEGVGQTLAQTFTPDTVQTLGYLELPVGCSDGVLLNVKIRAGLGGSILYEVNVADLPRVADGTFRLIQVYNPATSSGIRLMPWVTYAFELAAFPGPKAANNKCTINAGPPGDPYAGGQGWYRYPWSGWSPLPTASGNDLPFITLVR